MTPTRRFLLYSNEMIGLGHLRRMLSITARLAEIDAAATALVVTGSPIQPLFNLPPRSEAVTLPSRTRDAAGNHHSRRLALELGELQYLRASLSLAAAVAFRPHVAVVDKVPIGLGNELRPALEALKEDGCKLVLGLRDIEDNPLEVRRKWGPELHDAIRRYYDLILVYGPAASTLDAIDCLGWHDLEVPLVHVGYVGNRVPDCGPSDLPEGYILATVGGGWDGFRLLSAVIDAVRLAPLPAPAVIVTGPLMPADEVAELRRLAEGLDVALYEFRPDMEYVIAGARAVVSMAGYNTVSEIMRARKPALLVPRVRPSQEQLLRARELARTGAQEIMYPEDLSATNMRAALDRLLERPRPELANGIYLGTERTAELLSGLVDGDGVQGLRRTARPRVGAHLTAVGGRRPTE